MKPFEIIPVDRMEVACDGSAAPNNHPRVFLHIDVKSHKIQCPYCSRLYVYGDSEERKAG